MNSVARVRRLHRPAGASFRALGTGSVVDGDAVSGGEFGECVFVALADGAEAPASCALVEVGEEQAGFGGAGVEDGSEMPGFRDEATADPAAGVRTGWSYLAAEDGAVAVWHALTADLAGAHVIGLSAADTLLTDPSDGLLDRYAPQVPRRRRFAGNEALIDTTRAVRLLGFRPALSVHDPGRPRNDDPARDAAALRRGRIGSVA
jgi:hypothetical protein